MARIGVVVRVQIRRFSCSGGGSFEFQHFLVLLLIAEAVELLSWEVLEDI